MSKIDDLIPSEKEIQKQAALKEAAKADEHAKRLAAAEAEKHALIDRLSKLLSGPPVSGFPSRWGSGRQSWPCKSLTVGPIRIVGPPRRSAP